MFDEMKHDEWNEIEARLEEEDEEEESGEEDEADAREAEEAAREELEDSVGAKLKETFAEDDPGGEEDEEEEPGEEDEEDGDKDTPGDDEDDEPGDEDSDSGDEDDELEAAADDAPTLPDAYRRSLKAYDWTDDEIDNNLAQLGDGFIATAAKIHSNRNRELADWAAAGRRARERQETGRDNPADSRQDQQASDSPSQGLKPINAEELKERYGDDDMVDALVGPLNKTIEAINRQAEQLESGRRAAEQAEIERVSKHVDEFFDDDRLSDYSELYGTSQKGLSEDQLQHRNKVVDTAFDLISGAQALRNQQMNLDEALELAHDVVSKDFNETKVRSKIKKQAKRRSRSLSMKPASKADDLTKDSGTKTRSELEAATRQRLAKVFG